MVEIKTGANSRFAKAGVSCFYDNEVLNSSFVHLMKFSSENPRLRKAAKRQFEQSNSVHEQNATKIKQGEMPRLGPGLIAHEFGQNAARGRD
jgi:hypothetical protein